MSPRCLGRTENSWGHQILIRQEREALWKDPENRRGGSPATVLDMSLTTPYDRYTRSEDRAESIILFPDESDVHVC